MGDDLSTWAAKAKGSMTPAAAVPAVGAKSADLTWIAPVYRDQLRGWGKAKKVPGNPPAWATSPSVWDEARKSVEEGGWESYDEPWAVVADVYRKMGGGVK